MNIINYKQLNEIIPTSDTMIYCTCAEKNQKHYLEKIQLWFKRYGKINADFYVFNDGKILEENKNFNLDDKIKIIEFDEAYGRSSGCVFQGWKRSFCYACHLSLKYRFFSHIENDCFIKDLQKYENTLKAENIISTPKCQNYNCVESAMIILNKNDFKEKYFNYFIIKDNLYENVSFEERFEKLANQSIKYYGNSIRFEGGKRDSSEIEVLNQCTIEKLKELAAIYP